jgi:ADP-ribosylglycohydrolase
MKEKVLGSLVGVALGDALGMPTEFMTYRAIRDVYGKVQELVAPHKDHYHHPYLTRGQITDDTEQTLALLDALFRHRTLNAEVAAEALVTWATERDVFKSTYLGPSSKKALQRLLDGDNPEQTGFFGTTIGGAMRMLPVALFCMHNPEKTVEVAATVSMPTHGTNLAISGAASMAAGLVESFREGSDKETVIDAACLGAEQGLNYGYPYPGPSISKRIRWALDISNSEQDLENATAALYDYVGVDMVPHEILPVVFALFARPEEPMELLVAAANIGGDTDTIAALLGSLLGAFHGVSVFPESMWREIEAVNKIDLEGYVLQIMQVIDKRRACR